MTPPRDHFIIANRVKYHLIEWGDRGPVVLLAHGFLEHGHVWDWTAPDLAAAGYHVFALDWRGHGQSEWVGAGGYYHFPDYTADLAALVRYLGGRAVLVGHSMGGGAAVNYAGTEPERVAALVLIEGLNLPDSDPERAPVRFAAWLRDLERAEQRERRALALEAAANRFRQRFPLIPEAVARRVVEHNTEEKDGRRVWRFDPLHQTTSPQPYYVAQARAFWHRVQCPVLYVEGSESPMRLDGPEFAERLAVLRARREVIRGAAHHPHLEQPDRLVRVLLRFLAPAA